MIWGNKYENQWNEAFKELCRYYQQNENFDIPVNYVAESGIALGKWIRHQRDSYSNGKLSDERIEKLRDIGFVLEKIDPWEEKFKLAKAYYEENGNLNVPSQYVVNGVWLNKWLNEQKLIAQGKRKKKHTEEQIEKLKTIGLEIEKSRFEEIWLERYELAKKYYEEYGNLNIPRNYTVNGFKLGLWLSRQKMLYRNGELSKECIELLNKLAVEWAKK